MHRNTSIRALAALLTVVVASGPAAAFTMPPQDVPGSRDSPIVSRFAGAVIIGYQRLDFDQLTLPMRKFVAGRLTGGDTVDGRITRIAYVAPPGKSAFEVWMNYRQTLATAGFKTRFSCSSGDGSQGCGDPGDVYNALLPTNVWQALTSTSHHPGLIESTLDGDRAFVETVHLARSGGPVDVVLLVSQSDEYPAGVFLEICEGKAMATGEVTASIGKSLAKYGHVALSGIHFATDSARLTPDSDAELARMVALMKAQPTLKVYIVGHTDDTGTLAQNLELSQARADAVMKALAARGIAASRMAAKGLASYAPVASNLTAPGRAKNRRVELVEQ